MSGEGDEAPKDAVANTPDVYKEASYMPALLQAVNQMRLEESHCDVRLKIESTEIMAHRLVLCAASPVFKAMFSGDWSEEEEKEVVLLDVKPKVMRLVVDYVYSGEILLTKDNVESVLVAANFYQVRSLKDICCSFLSEMLDACNCVGIFCMADTMECSKLRKDSLEFVLKHFKEVVLFDELSKLPLNLLIVIISSDDLNVVNEEIPYKAVVKWVVYKSERKSVIDRALEHIRLPFLSGTFLYKSVRTLDVVEASSASRALVDEAVWYQVVSQTERSNMQTSRTVPRVSYKNTALVGVKQTGQYTTAGEDILVKNCDRRTRYYVEEYWQ